jgi:chemotaxis protein MotA
MLTIGAFGFLLVCVFGSYVVSGGSVEVLLEALPFEMWTIGGAAVGAFMMANSVHDAKHSAAGFKKIVTGAAFKKTDYVDLLSLLYYLVRLASTKGNMALESHIEHAEESPAFQKFPSVLSNHFATSMICDYLRMGPALGIVAAVLGVIKTMSHIDRPPAILGAMIGSALCGTFLGVLLAYGLAGPCASRLQAVIEEEAKYYEVIRAVLVTHLHGNAPQVSVESGRKMVPNEHMPSFLELEEAVQSVVIS